MNKPLRVLHLEDQPDFSTLVSAILEKEGLPAEKLLVTDFDKFTAALETNSFDIILADYSLPTCNGKQALQAARERCPQIPFLLLSGAIGEHAAVDILQSGATDYVLKSSLERLVPAMRRAVKEAAEHQQLRHAENEARTNEQQYRVIFDGSPVPMWVSDLKTGSVLEVNEAAIRHYGYSRKEFFNLTTKDICSREELALLARYVASLNGGQPDATIGRAGLSQHRKKDGSFLEVDLTWSVIQIHERAALLTIASDVTSLKPATEILKKNEARLAAALRIARLGSWELDLADLQNLDRNTLYWSDETYRIFGLKPDQAPSARVFLFDSIHPADRQRVKDTVDQAIRDKEPYATEYRIVLPDGGERVIAGRAEVVADESGRPVQLRGIVVDITQRQRAEAPPVPNKEPKSRTPAAPVRPERPSKTSKSPRPTSRPGR